MVARPEVWWTLPWKVPVATVLALLSCFMLFCATAAGCDPKPSVSKTRASESLIFGSIAVSPLFFCRLSSTRRRSGLLGQMECQRRRAQAKEENSMQIILAFEVYWEGR